MRHKLQIHPVALICPAKIIGVGSYNPQFDTLIKYAINRLLH